MGSGAARIAVGGYEGTGVAFNIEGEKVDFQPKKIEILRVGTPDKSEWVEGMDDSSMVLTTGSTGVRTEVTVGGLYPRPGGFRVGVHASINTAGDTYRYVAHE